MPATEDAVEALWNAWHRHVLAYALRRTDPSTAEEVVAETFLIAWRRLDDLPPDRPLPWLLAVARRVLANQRRAERRRHALHERIAQTHAPTSEPDAGRAIDALHTLNERDREALLLHAWEGLDHTDAGTVMGCSAATFAVRLHRARRRFADALAAIDEREVTVR